MDSIQALLSSCIRFFSKKLPNSFESNWLSQVKVEFNKTQKIRTICVVVAVASGVQLLKLSVVIVMSVKWMHSLEST